MFVSLFLKLRDRYLCKLLNSNTNDLDGCPMVRQRICCVDRCHHKKEPPTKLCTPFFALMMLKHVRSTSVESMQRFRTKISIVMLRRNEVQMDVVIDTAVVSKSLATAFGR